MIQSTISINDKMSPILQKITKNMDVMLQVMSSIGSSLGGSFHTDEIENMAASIHEMNAGFEETQQQVEDNNQLLDDMKNNIKHLPPEADNVTTKLDDWRMKLLAVNAGLDLVKKGFSAIRSVASTVSKFLSAYDTELQATTQLKVVMQNQGNSLEDYQNIVDKASALQTTTTIGDEGYIGAAAELSTYLADAQAVSDLMDTFSNYAIGMAGGSDIGYKEAVDYATQLGKVLEGSYDGITRKGFALSDAQKEIIENGTDMEKVAVIADVINQSWDGLAEAMANTPTGSLTQTKNLLGDIQEEIGKGLYPAVLQLNATLIKTLSSGDLEPMISVVISVFKTLMHVLEEIAPLIVSIGTLISEVFKTIQPLLDIMIGVFGLVADGLSYAIGLLSNAFTWIQDNAFVLIGVLSILSAIILNSVIPAIVTAIRFFVSWIAYLALSAFYTVMDTSAKIAAAFAQEGLNAAIAACPITWVIAGLIAVVAALIYFSDAAGLVGGIIFAVVAFIAKRVLWLATPFVMIAEFFANVFRDPAEAVKMLFINAFNAILDGVATLADGVDSVINKFAKFFKWLGLDLGIESNIGDTVRAMKIDIETSDEYISYMDQLEELQNSINIDDAFDAGFKTFKNGAESIKNSMNDLLNFGKDYENTMTDIGDYNALFDDTFDVGDIGNVGNVGSVGSIKDDVTIADEDLKYLRDIAEIEYVNKYTTSEVHVNANFGDVHETADTQKIADALAEAVKESLAVNLT